MDAKLAEGADPISRVDFQEESSDLRHDAAHVVKTFPAFLRTLSVSESLPKSPTLVYINLTTLEGTSYCIQLSSCGYKVAGLAYDTVSLERDDSRKTVYESLSSLLEAVSPLYTVAFGEALIRKLEVVQHEQESDEFKL